MKKIFTLLFAVGMFTLAQAQPGSRDNRQTDRRDNPPTDQRNQNYDQRNQTTDQRNQNYDQRNQTYDQRDQSIDQRNQPYDQRNQNYSYDDNRGFVDFNFSFDNDSRYGNSRFSNERKRDMQIARINREYDYQIQSVRNNFFMWGYEKERQIRFLQEQRQREIRMVYAKFSYRNRYDDRYGRNNPYDRHDRYEHSNGY